MDRPPRPTTPAVSVPSRRSYQWLPSFPTRFCRRLDIPCLETWPTARDTRFRFNPSGFITPGASPILPPPLEENLDPAGERHWRLLRHRRSIGGVQAPDCLTGVHGETPSPTWTDG